MFLFVDFFSVSLHGDYCKCTVQRWASPRRDTVDPMLLPSGNPFNCHVAPVAQRYHVTSDTLGREFDPGKRDFSH